jgi:SPP1 gp7 family putative phage head morphogenesis protein
MLSKRALAAKVNWAEAANAAASLLLDIHSYRIEKALDPLEEAGYVSLVASLAEKLKSSASKTERKNIEAAIKLLDVDWTSLSDKEKSDVLVLVEEQLEETSSQAIPLILAAIGVGLIAFGRKTRGSLVETHGLKTPKGLSETQESVIDAVSEIGPWLALEYERRLSRVSRDVRAIIDAGLKQGKTAAEIHAELSAVVPKFGLSYNDNYWLLVADNLMNRVRSYVSLSTFKKVGITKYRFTAVMDERTTIECRMLHGTIFDVEAGLSKYQDLFAKSATDPMALEKVMPFVKRRKAAGGATELYVTDAAGNDVTIGVNTLSGVGQEGATGAYKDVLSPDELEALGVAVPPIHHGCRSAIIPVR